MHRYIEKIAPKAERKAFLEFLDASGFACREETHNSAYRPFAGGSETSG